MLQLNPRDPRKPPRFRQSLAQFHEYVRDGLARVARARLKNSRVNDDRMEQTGSVAWRIECRIER